MFPYLTRIFWLLAQPLSLVAIFLALGLLLSFRKGRWLSRTSFLVATLILGLCAFTTFGYLLISPLETRFVRPPEPARIDGIVVLGGGIDSDITTTMHNWEFNRSGDRYVEALRLALTHPEAKVIIAAGPAGAFAAPNDEPEAYAAARFFEAFGIAKERLLIDDKSRNTDENAVNAKALAGDASGQTWLLVTSAFHMPRSVGLFRAVDFPVVPWPADYLASGAEGVGLKLDQLPENMAVTSIALREWSGLLGYKLAGKIADVLPGP
jgi:uncharacterized SAM-binding protein YcdF (DUF218 family)